MGNCLRINRDFSEKESSASAREMEAVETRQELTPSTSKLKMKKCFVSGKWKKTTARFNVEPRAGVLRIKAVVTRRELKQILNYKKDVNYSSLDHLLAVMKPRGLQLRINDEDESVNSNCIWRPALKSIPEDHESGSCI